MTYDGELPQYVTGIVNGVEQTVPAYRYRANVPDGVSGRIAIPHDNDESYITMADNSQIAVIPGYTTGAEAPGVFVMGNLPGAWGGHPTAYDDYNAYAGALSEGAPGAFPGFLGLTWAILLKFILAVIVIIALAEVAMHFIDAATSTSVTPISTLPDGSVTSAVCFGTIFSRQCVTYNPQHPEDTTQLGSTGDWLTYIVIGAVVIGGLYVGVKYILPALTPQSERLKRMRK